MDYEFSPVHDEAEPYKDSTEELLDRYDHRRRSRSDDSAAMQSVVCILLAASLFAANFRFPEQVGQLLQRFSSLAEAEAPLIPNPIDLLLDLL